MRFFKELVYPVTKCQRVGHVLGFTQHREGYVKDTKGFRTVADNLSQSRPYCTRCKTGLGEWKDRYRYGLASLGMATTDWLILENEGAFWTKEWVERD